jgi:hypothetical protein
MEPTMTHSYDLAYAADLAKCGQITTDYQQLARKLAGPLEPIVAKVFPGHLLMVYLLTDVSRRQVWNAYMTSPSVATHLPQLTDEEAQELRVKLLICRSYDLIVDGYGSSERGLIGLYGKLGAEAQSAEFYPLFHQTLTENEPVRRSLCHVPAIDPKVLSLVFTLPTPLQSYPFARDLVSCEIVGQFLELHAYLQGQDFSNKDASMERLYRLVRIGRGFRSALKAIRLALPFPAQAVPNEGQLRFISNGEDLSKAAERYRNCLRRELSAALNGECQFYEWACSTPAVICLNRYRGDNWYISAMNLADNADPSAELEAEIRCHFARHGIGERRCVADLFDRVLQCTVDITEELEEFTAVGGQ